MPSLAVRPRTRLPLALALVAACSVAPPAPADTPGVDQPVSIRTRDTELGSLLSALCTPAGLNLVLGPEVARKKVTLQVSDLPLRRVLRYLGGLYDVGIALTPDGRTLLVGTRDAIAGLDLGRARVLKLTHTSAVEFAALLNQTYQGELEVYPDPRTNTVVVVPRR